MVTGNADGKMMVQMTFIARSESDEAKPVLFPKSLGCFASLAMAERVAHSLTLH